MNAQQTFEVMVNKDQIEKTQYWYDFNWKQSFTKDGSAWENKVSTTFILKESAEAFISLLSERKLTWSRNWIN